MKPLPGLLETYVRARLAWWERVLVVGGDLAAAERHAMQRAHQAWQEAGFPGYTTEADTAAVFALVARECGVPAQPETLLEAVERLAAFKRGEA